MKEEHAQIHRALAESDTVFDQPEQPRASAPNVLMIVVDDLGFADLGCYGSEIATPHVDALAERGLRYNNFHVTPICSSTRACLMTGRNHHAVGMGFLPDYPMNAPGYTGRIPNSAGILPRLLRDSGYNTFAVGKWHLVPRYEDTSAGPFDRWPLGAGFERFYGFLGGLTSQWTPDLVRDNCFIEPPLVPEEDYHVTDDLVTNALRLVQDQQQAAPGKPFLLYFCTGAMHEPHQVPHEWVEPYRGRFDDGWGAIRERVFRRQLELGVVPAETTLTERPAWVAAWDDLSSDERRVYARQMEVYAGFLSHTDTQIGRLVQFLDMIGVLDNTIIMVLSDNGASAEGGPHGRLGSHAVDVQPMLSRIDDFGGANAWNHYAWGWAWTGNTPFKLWKRYSWLGGVRVPLIIRWPRGISVNHSGHVRRQFCHAIDLMPTILDAADVETPEVLDGFAQQPIGGTSVLPTFMNADSPSPRATQYFEMMGSRAIYHEGWKATTDHVCSTYSFERELIKGSHNFDTDRWQLFCLESDFSEAEDIAEDYPDRLRQMIELWWHEAGRNQVLPLVDGILGRTESTEDMHLPPNSEPLEYVCGPGGTSTITPSPFVAGFRLTAEFELSEDRSAAGVICAHRNYIVGCTHPEGWACYLLDGRLSVTFNPDGFPSQLFADRLIPAGRHQLTVAYLPRSDGDGLLTITVDGREAAAKRVRGKRSDAFTPYLQAKLLIGRDQITPISDEYRAPFPFSGEIHRVIYVAFPPTKARDLRKDIADALRYD